MREALSTCQGGLLSREIRTRCPCRSVVPDDEDHSKPGKPGPGREPGKLALIAGVDAAAARASVCTRTGPNCREQLRWKARAYWKRAPERAEARRLQPGPPLAEGRAGAGHPGADWPRHRAGLRWAHATPGGPGKEARGGLGKPGSCCGQLQLPPFPVCARAATGGGGWSPAPWEGSGGSVEARMGPPPAGESPPHHPNHST